MYGILQLTIKRLRLIHENMVILIHEVSVIIQTPPAPFFYLFFYSRHTPDFKIYVGLVG